MVGICLVKDPKKRPTSEKLLKHPFFKQARAPDYMAKAILNGLPPLGERYRTIKVCAPSLKLILTLAGEENCWKSLIDM